MKKEVRMLTTDDVYDFYACMYLRPIATADMDAPYAQTIDDRICEIHSLYITACTERIKAEARFLGINDDELETFSLQDLLDKIGELVLNGLQSNAETMMRGGTVNFAKILIQANMMTGQDMTGIDLAKFGVSQPVEEKKPDGVNAEWFKGKRKNGSMCDDPKWHEIAKAYLEVERSVSISDMIQTIDRLNDLQHNSFHLLIDLQTGRMLEGQSKTEVDHNEAFNTVHDVLDIKRNSKSPLDYADKLSLAIKEVLKTYRGAVSAAANSTKIKKKK